LLTANEYRALQAAIIRDKIEATLATDDPLRRQLAAMFKLPLMNVADVPRPAPISLHENGAPPEPISLNERRRKKNGEPEPKEDVDKDQAPEPKDEKPERPFPIRTIGIAVGAVVAILAVGYIAAYFFLTEATIELIAKRQAVAADLTVGITPQGQPTPSDVDFTLNGTSITVPVSASETAQVTGVITTGDQPAKGAISFSNTTNAPVTLAAGTQITDKLDGTVFTLDADVQLPAMNGDTPGFGSGAVTATVPGSVGNRDVGVLSGLLRDGVYFSNRESAIQGGTDRQITAVSQQDIDALEQQARDAMIAGITAPNGQTVLPASVALADISYSPSHQVGEEATSLTIAATATASAIAYDKSALSSNVIGSGKVGVPEGYEIDASTLSVSDPAPINADAPDGRYTISIQGQAQAVITAERRAEIRDAAAGSSESELSAYLATVPEIDTFEITYAPGWLPRRMPGSADKITVETT
jgi:hypothetical protein